MLFTRVGPSRLLLFRLTRVPKVSLQCGFAFGLAYRYNTRIKKNGGVVGSRIHLRRVMLTLPALTSRNTLMSRDVNVA